MICSRCQSNNVIITNESETQVSNRGCLSWLWWIFLATITLGIILIIPLITNTKSRTTHSTIAICQNCGYRWYVTNTYNSIGAIGNTKSGSSKGVIIALVILGIIVFSIISGYQYTKNKYLPNTKDNTAVSTESDNSNKQETSSVDTTATNDVQKDIKYEEIGVRGLTVYVYTELKELNILRIIADKYKNVLFKNVPVFQIFFFDNKQNAEHALKSSSLNYEDGVSLVARYNFNSNTQMDEISYDIEEKIFEESPTIKLEVSEGPLLSEDGTICYYRIKAGVTGFPAPTIKFSKDDSLGNLGKNMVQINLTNIGESYTLTATVSNSIGKASDSIILNWVEK